YQEAFSTLNNIRNSAPTYHRMDQVLTTLSELSLDVLHAPDKAKKFLAELENFSGEERNKANQAYIKGRLHLYEKEYT
ncbi:MAG: hypothetical protein GWN00_11400, partial [Aliifodinibius sp.]|nr:hypothetical protein [Fodinibius sp.]NIV11750.1 hypothetical protein [Fodinibius sp.]NIY25388.1 hypothetical protein [Fodinibius sp.]